MRVHELITALQGCDPQAVVVIPKNVFGDPTCLVDEVEPGYVFIPDHGGTGVLAYPALTEETLLNGYSDADVYAGGNALPAVALWMRDDDEDALQGP